MTAAGAGQLAVGRVRSMPTVSPSSAAAPTVYPSAAPSSTSATPAPCASMATAPGGTLPLSAVAACTRSAVRATVSGPAAARRPGQATELRGQGGAEKGDIGQAATELLGDDGDLDRGRPRRPVVLRRPQFAPAGRADRGVELGRPLPVVEVGDAVDAQAVDHLRRAVAQGDLFC